MRMMNAIETERPEESHFDKAIESAHKMLPPAEMQLAL